MEHTIETVKRSKVKFDDVIIGSFCKAVYNFDIDVNKPSNKYQEYKTGSKVHISKVPTFHVYFANDVTPLIVEGFGQVVRIMNGYDLKQFRKFKTK